jgi:hypothetical protein
VYCDLPPIRPAKSRKLAVGTTKMSFQRETRGDSYPAARGAALLREHIPREVRHPHRHWCEASIRRWFWIDSAGRDSNGQLVYRPLVRDSERNASPCARLARNIAAAARGTKPVIVPVCGDCPSAARVAEERPMMTKAACHGTMAAAGRLTGRRRVAKTRRLTKCATNEVAHFSLRIWTAPESSLVSVDRWRRLSSRPHKGPRACGQ